MPLSPHLAVTYTAYATSFCAFISSNKQRKEVIRKIGSTHKDWIVDSRGTELQAKSSEQLAFQTSTVQNLKIPYWPWIALACCLQLLLTSCCEVDDSALSYFANQSFAFREINLIYMWAFWSACCQNIHENIHNILNLNILRIRILQSVIRIFYLTSVYQQTRLISILDLRIEPTQISYGIQKVKADLHYLTFQLLNFNTNFFYSYIRILL